MTFRDFYFRTFFPNKLAKHQKSCTQEKPMSNPNKVKGVASKLESLVSYPELKKRKVRRKEAEIPDSDENISCNCQMEEEKDKLHELLNFCLSKDYKISDFINVTEEKKITSRIKNRTMKGNTKLNINKAESLEKGFMANDFVCKYLKKLNATSDSIKIIDIQN